MARRRKKPKHPLTDMVTTEFLHQINELEKWFKDLKDALNLPEEATKEDCLAAIRNLQHTTHD